MRRDHAKPGASGLRGAVPTLDALIGLRADARRLRWAVSERVRSSRSGIRSSRFLGRGIDFAETRAYEPGDDVRHMDWRVTARTGVAHTKIFSEERERPVLVVADLGPSTFFGTRRRTKSLAVAELAGLLLWLAHDGGDRIGAIVRGPETHHAFRPRHSRATVLRIQRALVAEATALAERYRADSEAGSVDGPAFSLADALTQARRVARPGTSVIVISDFPDASALAEHGVVRRQLRLLARHCAVDAIRVTDPFERELPEADRYPLSDGVSRALLDTGPERTRRAWRDAHADRGTQLDRTIAGGRGRVLTVATDDALELRLGGWLR